MLLLTLMFRVFCVLCFIRQMSSFHHYLNKMQTAIIIDCI